MYLTISLPSIGQEGADPAFVHKYGKAIANSRVVAAQIALLIKKLHGKNVVDSFSKITLIGHSIGAHIMGDVGNRLKELKQSVGTIIGLDPAGPCFFRPERNDSQRLDKNDADYVQGIYTNAGPSWNRLGYRAC